MKHMILSCLKKSYITSLGIVSAFLGYVCIRIANYRAKKAQIRAITAETNVEILKKKIDIIISTSKEQEHAAKTLDTSDDAVDAWGVHNK